MITLNDSVENVLYNGQEVEKVVLKSDGNTVGTVVWEKKVGFVPFVLGKADGLVYAKVNTNTYLYAEYSDSKGGFAWVYAGLVYKCLAAPIAGYKYNPMNHVTGSYALGNSYNTHTLLNIPKGCKKVTFKYTKTTYASLIKLRLIASNSEGTLDTGLTNYRTYQVSLNITFKEESWLQVRIYDEYDASTPEALLGNDYTITFE